MPIRSRYSNLAFIGLATLTISAALTLTGCIAAEEAEPLDPSASTEPQATANATFIAGGTAEQNLPFFSSVLTKFANGDAEINGVNLVNALADSGFDKSLMQVSKDTTQTNLRADAIFVSVRVGETCLIGQVETDTRKPRSSVQPAAGADRSLCLIGNTVPITW